MSQCTAAQAQQRSWVEAKYQEALAAVPHDAERTRADALFRAGWSPYFGFPPVDLLDGQVVALDPSGVGWRTTPLASYFSSDPAWTPFLSLKVAQVLTGTAVQPRPWNNTVCLDPAERCLVAVTDAGFDVIRWVELKKGSEEPATDAFVLPPARSWATWLTSDRLLVASAAHSRLSASGYGLTVRSMDRGQALVDAKVVHEADSDSAFVAVDSWTLARGRIGVIHEYKSDGTTKRVLLVRDTGEVVLTSLPPGALVVGSVGNELVVSLTSDWLVASQTLSAGSVLSFPLDELARLNIDQMRVVFAATDERSVEVSGSSRPVQTVKDGVYLTVLEAGSRHVEKASFDGFAWHMSNVLGDPGQVAKILTGDAGGDTVLLSLESPLSAPALYSVSGTQAPQLLRLSPSLFDARGLSLDRREVDAGDGAKIVYWLIQPTGRTSPVPTVIHAYGASRIPLLPAYRADVGAMWLERGGAYVIAQVRGGGERGPTWSAAGSGLRRGTAVDDLIAVAEHLVETGVTTAGQLGLDGQSAGGWLVSSAGVRRPDLFAGIVSRDGAVDPEAPSSEGSPLMQEDLDLLRTEAGRAVANEYWPKRAFDLQRGCPDMLLTTWAGDQRVPALQSQAFVGHLATKGCSPLLLQRPGGDHSGVDPLMLAVVYGFLSEHLGLPTEGAASSHGDD